MDINLEPKDILIEAKQNGPFIKKEDLDLCFQEKKLKNAEDIDKDYSKKQIEKDYLSMKEIASKLKLTESAFFVDYFKDLRYIPIDQLTNWMEGYDDLSESNEFHKTNLINSINEIGVFAPLVVLRDGESFKVVLGMNRFHAVKALYEVTKDEKFSKVPCFVLDSSEVSKDFLKVLKIDSDISYKDIKKDDLMRLIMKRRDIIKALKAHRNDINIGKEISRELGISESTYYNFLPLINLSENSDNLFSSHEINLTTARLLSKVEPKVQDKISEVVGCIDLNKCKILKDLVCDKDLKIENVEDKVRELSDKTPETTIIKIEIRKDCVDAFAKLVDVFKDSTEEFFSQDEEFDIDECIKVSCNKNDMNRYFVDDIVDANTMITFGLLDFDKSEELIE